VGIMDQTNLQFWALSCAVNAGLRDVPEVELDEAEQDDLSIRPPRSRVR
jgi:hypothetical protein